MTELIVRGTLDEVQLKLVWVSQAVRYRKAGWLLFQEDEEWLYRTQNDARVCHVCREFESQGVFRGDEIPSIFPAWERLDTFVVHPRVHRIPAYSYLKGECRCTLTMQNPIETLEARLHREKLEALA